MGNVQDLRKQGRTSGRRWLAEWRSPDGRKHRKVFATREAALAHVEDQESDKRRGLYVRPNHVTVGDLWPRWEATKASLARSTREGYGQAWATYVARRWADVAVADVDRAAVLEWLPGLRTKAGRPLSASWARQVAIVLRGILDLAIDARLLHTNPLHRMGRALPKQLPSDRRYLTVVEVDRLIATAEGTGLALPIRVLIMTGVRRGEMAGLRVGDLDAKRGRLRVARDVDAHGEVDATKTGRHRDVPVGGQLLKDLATAARGRPRGEWLMPDPAGSPWRRDSWRSRWDRIADDAGLDGLDTHELRHTAVSLAIHSGANVKTVQRMVGHASAAITLDVYGHLWDDELDAMPGRIEAHMAAERKRATPQPPHKTAR